MGKPRYVYIVTSSIDDDMVVYVDLAQAIRQAVNLVSLYDKRYQRAERRLSDGVFCGVMIFGRTTRAYVNKYPVLDLSPEALLAGGISLEDYV